MTGREIVCPFLLIRRFEIGIWSFYRLLFNLLYVSCVLGCNLAKICCPFRQPVLSWGMSVRVVAAEHINLSTSSCGRLDLTLRKITQKPLRIDLHFILRDLSQVSVFSIKVFLPTKIAVRNEQAETAKRKVSVCFMIGRPTIQSYRYLIH